MWWLLWKKATKCVLNNGYIWNLQWNIILLKTYNLILTDDHILDNVCWTGVIWSTYINITVNPGVDIGKLIMNNSIMSNFPFFTCLNSQVAKHASMSEPYIANLNRIESWNTIWNWGWRPRWNKAQCMISRSKQANKEFVCLKSNSYLYSMRNIYILKTTCNGTWWNNRLQVCFCKRMK